MSEFMPSLQDPPDHAGKGRFASKHRQQAMDLARANPGAWVKADECVHPSIYQTYRRHGFKTRLVGVAPPPKADIYILWADA